MKSPVNLFQIITILKRHLRFILITVFSVTALSGLYTHFFITPVYEASTQILVNQPPSEGEVFTSSELETSRDLIETYNTIITSPRILDPAIENLSQTITREDLLNKINVSGEGESQVLSIRVEDNSQESAAEIADTIAGVFQNELPLIMNIDNVSVLAAAETQEEASPVSPNLILNMGSFFILSLGTAVGIVFLLELLDRTIKSDTQLEEELKVPVIGMISTIQVENKPKIEVLPGKTKSQGSETYGA
jgi:capsular polysaccharide biosynthesis protein